MDWLVEIPLPMFQSPTNWLDVHISIDNGPASGLPLS
jgi:hypothetical protein